MSATKKEFQRKTLLYLWNDGVRNARELHARTNIPLSTIYDNIKKLKKTGTTKHAGGNGRPRKIIGNAFRRCLGNPFGKILPCQRELWQKSC